MGPYLTPALSQGRHLLVWREALGPRGDAYCGEGAAGAGHALAGKASLAPTPAPTPTPLDALRRFCVLRPSPTWVVVLCRGAHLK